MKEVAYIAIGVVVGILVGFILLHFFTGATNLAIPPLFAQGSGASAGSYAIVPIKINVQDGFVLLDAAEKKLVLYRTSGAKVELVSVRQFGTDLLCDEYPARTAAPAFKTVEEACKKEKK
jgi:hypothetical protein